MENGVKGDIIEMENALNWEKNFDEKLWMKFPPIGEIISDDEKCESWLNVLTPYTLQDLNYLLKLPIIQFWSRIVNDKSVRIFLASCLSGLPRNHDFLPLKPSVQLRCTEIKSSLFKVFIRLGTLKESPKHHFPKEYYGKLIYDHFIFDVPKLLDLAVLFGGNEKMMEKLMANIFTHQPNYLRDLSGAAELISEALDKLNCKIENVRFLKDEELKDIAEYVTDILVTLHSFLKIAPKSAVQVFKSYGFDLKLPSFYHHEIVSLIKQIQFKNLQNDLEKYLNVARDSLIKSVHIIINACCLQSVIESDDMNEIMSYSEDYLHVTTTLLSEKAFLNDYLQLYSIEDDFAILKNKYRDLDPMRIQYILGGIHEIKLNEKIQRDKQDLNNYADIIEPETSTSVACSSAVSAAETGPPKHNLTEIELTSLVTQVNDLLSELGDGFIRHCLEYYDYNPEKVINGIFENNLPPHLDSLDRTLPYIPPEDKSNLTRRNNVYNDDEFDINSRDKIDTSRIHKGKRSNKSDLNDKTFMTSELKDRYAAMSIVTDYELTNDYDDEYDDTYDDNNMGREEPDAFEERPFVLPRALGGGHVIYVREDYDDDDEEEEETKTKMNFCRNPEDIRREAEERRQSKMGRNKKGVSGPPQPPPNRDVVGRAKGQGQDKSVLINRARKNANKNKHQRAMADKKATKGMF